MLQNFTNKQFTESARAVGLLKAHSPSNKASFFAAIQNIKSFIVEYCLNIEYTSKWK
ncbi:hypothetical protein T09_2920 [Trichinella sp. T9]|nr:hypothetical protein T09_2920 [Trichinella sp. T9]